MTDWNENTSGTPAGGNAPEENRAFGSTPEENIPLEGAPQERAPFESAPEETSTFAGAPQEGPPPPTQGDPYRTTASNAQPGWQQTGGAYNQYNPRTGWAGGPAGTPGAGMPNHGGYQNVRPGTQGADYSWNFSAYETAEKDNRKGKKKHRGLMVFTGIICSLFAVTVIGFAGFGVWQLVAPESMAGTPESTASLAPDAAMPELTLRDVPRGDEVIAADGKLTPTQVASKVRPSVVGIVAYVPSSANSFYGYGDTLAQSEGSGIIMSADGYVITNAHVISGATGIKVVLNNDEEYTAEIVGSDPATDLAVIKIEADNLTPAEFGDSSALEVGEYVAAIGNPGGLMLSNSMTQGIVSGINRPLSGSDGGYTMNYIQTDAAINPGNSGGALVNEYGQVIGINSVKIAQTEYEGLGFAIPISDAKPIIDDLIANGKVTGRVRLGVEGRQLDEMTARYNDIPLGFQIYKLDPGADIASKGVVAGDIITKIDGQELSAVGGIREYLRDFKPGDVVTLTVFRRTSGRQDTTFEVSVKLMEDSGEAAVPVAEPTEQ